MSDHDNDPMHKTGFTLIEVLVAVTILGGGILGVLAAFSLSFRASVSAGRLSDAVRIAERELGLTVARPAGQLEPASGQEMMFSWKTEIAELPEGLMRARIDVQWSDRGKTETFQLERIFLPPEASNDEDK